jgi:DNA-binding MarR family transcriptional regulator
MATPADRPALDLPAPEQARDPAPDQAADPATSPAMPARDDAAYELTEVVTRLRRVLRASIRTEYPWESLPMAQVELMQTLREYSPARVGDLATRLRLSASTVSGLVSQLMNSGLAVRGTHQDDRRVAVVELTDAGREQLAGWQDAHQRRIGAALEKLSGADRAAVIGALPALAKLVEHLGGAAEQ